MIDINNLSFTYSESDTPALNDVNLKINEGEFVVITGRNGSGKSTLIKALLGIIPDHIYGNFSGQITLSGQPILSTLSVASKIGVLLQDPDSQITNLTVWEEVLFGLENLCLPIDNIFQQANHALKQMNLEKIISQSTYQLSGGQKQRLSLAALLAMKPRVLIMDEPLANLDDDGINSVITALKVIKSQVDLVIVSSHCIEPFLELMTRIIVIDKGQISIDIPANQVEKYNTELALHAVQLHQQNIVLTPATKTNHPNLINLSHVAYSYSNGITPLVDVNLSISEDEKLTLIGKNGSGKSTLARLLVGLRKPSRGKVESRINQSKFVPQDVSLSFMENSVIDELINQGISPEIAEGILVHYDLEQHKSHSPFQLSGGQQRLLAIASALATHPDLIIIDEPTAGLDFDHVKLILKMTSSDQGAVLHITHDHRVISHANRVIKLESGRIVENGGKL